MILNPMILNISSKSLGIRACYPTPTTSCKKLLDPLDGEGGERDVTALMGSVRVPRREVRLANLCVCVCGGVLRPTWLGREPRRAQGKGPLLPSPGHQVP